MSTWRALASSNKNKVEQLSDDDWETDANFENDITEQEQRWGSKTVKNSGRLADNINFKQVIEDIQIEDKKVKEQFIHDSCNASSGFGGKFGVQKERVDRSAVNYDYHPELNKHESQKDYSKGFGGKFGVQKDRVDKSAVDWNYHEKVDKHESQKDYSKGFGGKFGVQKDRVDKSAVDWNYHEKVDKHTSQINATKPASVNKIKVPEFKDEHPGQENKSNNELNRSIGKVKVPNFQTDEQENKSNNESNRSIGKVKVPNFQTDEQQQPKTIDSNKPISTGKLKLPTQFTNSNETDKTSIKQANEPINRGNANALKSKFENLIKDSDSENQRKIEEERLRRLQKEKDEKNKAKQEEEERQKKLKIEAEQRKLTEQENEIEQNDESDDEQVISSSSKVNKIGVSVLPSTQLTKQNSRTSNRSSSFDSENEFNDNEQQINESEKSGSKILNEIVNVNENQVTINEKESINEKKKEEEELKRLKELELQRELEEEELRKKLAEEVDESLIEDEVNDVKEIKAVALYDYEAQEGDEISFLPGDVITNIEKVDSGWWRGQVDGGKVGLFPSNYVEELS